MRRNALAAAAVRPFSAAARVGLLGGPADGGLLVDRYRRWAEAYGVRNIRPGW